jgi:CubicO group peptidase (beta-lactamase class C family)
VLDLDTDVSAYLRTWKRLEGCGITLRHLLAHRSGLAPTPAPGYPRDGELPTVLDLLTGGGALSRAAAEPEVPAGQLFRKANTHYWVVEQVLTDVTGQPFPELLDELVFSPVGMRHSSVLQDFPERYAGPVAHGHDAEGRLLPGGWRRWPDLAAGGLWSTATDLARLTLEIRRGHLGRPLALLSEASARQMLTVQHRYSGYGLGTVVDDAPAGLGFGHGGSADGYHGVTLCRVERGSGFVVLTNSDDGAAVAKGFLTRLDREQGA